MNNREATLQVIADTYAEFAHLDIPAEDTKDLVIDKLANLLVIERNINIDHEQIRRCRW